MYVCKPAAAGDTYLGKRRWRRGTYTWWAEDHGRTDRRTDEPAHRELARCVCMHVVEAGQGSAALYGQTLWSSTTCVPAQLTERYCTGRYHGSQTDQPNQTNSPRFDLLRLQLDVSWRPPSPPSRCLITAYTSPLLSTDPLGPDPFDLLRSWCFDFFKCKR